MNQIVLHDIIKVKVKKTTKEKLSESNIPYCVTHIVVVDSDGKEMDITLFSNNLLVR